MRLSTLYFGATLALSQGALVAAAISDPGHTSEALSEAPEELSGKVKRWMQKFSEKTVYLFQGDKEDSYASKGEY